MGKEIISERAFIQAGPLAHAQVEIVKRFASGNAIAILLEIVHSEGTYYAKGSRVVLLPGEY
jgi:hypothetical protein